MYATFDVAQWLVLLLSKTWAVLSIMRFWPPGSWWILVGLLFFSLYFPGLLYMELVWVFQEPKNLVNFCCLICLKNNSGHIEIYVIPKVLLRRGVDNRLGCVGGGCVVRRGRPSAQLSRVANWDRCVSWLVPFIVTKCDWPDERFRNCGCSIFWYFVDMLGITISNLAPVSVPTLSSSLKSQKLFRN